MRIAILADIHANLTAFEAVLEDIERRGGVDEMWSLGDVVDYGPDPRECIALQRKLCRRCVLGNHDAAAIGKIDTSDFNAAAAASNAWTAQQLTAADRDYLLALPLTIEELEFTLVHGSPRDPVYEYLFSLQAARENLSAFRTKYGVVGHTHTPLAFTFDEWEQGNMVRLEPDASLPVAAERLIVNPGSVGQPRDGDSRAGYGIYDSEKRLFTVHRVRYDIASVQERMRAAGLPPLLVARLGVGR